MNGPDAKAKLQVIMPPLGFTYEWLKGLGVFRIQRLTYVEAVKVKKLLESQGCRASMDSGIFGSAT